MFQSVQNEDQPIAPGLQVPPEFLHTAKTGRRSRNYPTLDLSKLAQTCHMSQVYLGSILRGRRPGTVKALQRISQALGMGLEELLKVVQEVKDRETKQQTAKHNHAKHKGEIE